MTITVIACPRCNVDNDAAASRCVVCKAPLHTHVVDERRLRATYVALGAAMGIYVVARLVGLGNGAALALGMFYGPLIACFVARGNAVAPASLGGVLALLIVVFFTIVDQVTPTERRLAALIDHGAAHPSAAWVVLAVGVLAGALWPLALTGAVAGEHLAVRRRQRGR